jgi:hypothetical protein
MRIRKSAGQNARVAESLPTDSRDSWGSGCIESEIPPSPRNFFHNLVRTPKLRLPQAKQTIAQAAIGQCRIDSMGRFDVQEVLIS